MQIEVKLNIAGSDTGPFMIYSDVDGYTVAYGVNISKSAITNGVTITVPPATNIIKIRSNGKCTNSIFVTLPPKPTTTTTTSTTSTTTTTTTIRPTTTSSTTTSTTLQPPPSAPTTTSSTTTSSTTTTTIEEGFKGKAIILMDYNGVDKEVTFRLFDSVTQSPINSPTTFNVSGYVQLFTSLSNCTPGVIDCSAYSTVVSFGPGMHEVTASVTNCGKCSNYPYLRRGVVRVNGTNLFWNGGNNPDIKAINALFSVQTGVTTDCEITLCAVTP